MGLSIFKTPAYVYQSASGYVFRLRIPKDLKRLIGKTEFRYSLVTGSLQIAKYRARKIVCFIQELFQEVRTRMSEYTSEMINVRVRNYIKETLKNDERCRALDLSRLEDKTTLEGSNMGKDESESMLALVKRWLANADNEVMAPVARKILEQDGKEVDPDSVDYKMLSRGLLKGFQGILNVRLQRAIGNYTMSDHEIIPELQHASEESVVPEVAIEKEEPSNGLLFSDVEKKYCSEVQKAEGWTEKTTNENLSIFALFKGVVGDLAIEKIDRLLMANYKDTLLCLPPNMNKLPQYRDVTVHEILKLKPEKTLSVTTVNKYIRRLGGLFNYAVRNGYLPSNPAEGMQIRTKKRADEEREIYSSDDLKVIFGSAEYVEGNHKHPYGYWAPLLGLYTGCRIEEICQLHLDDIYQIDGVWVIDVNDKNEKRVKTNTSKRVIPLHPKLMELGLLTFVDVLKANGETRLFPELRQGRDGYSQAVSKWYTRFKNRCGITGNKTFHSFRHTFITALKHKQVEPFMIHELDGHAINSETMGRYGKRFTPQILLEEAILKLDYNVEVISWRY